MKSKTIIFIDLFIYLLQYSQIIYKELSLY